MLVVADEYALACHVLGALRVTLGSPPVGEGPHRYVWVTEFPLFEGVDEDGHLMAAHHPFTMPHPEDLDLHRERPAVGALPGLRPRAQRLGAGQRVGAHPPRRHPVAGLRRAGHHAPRRPRAASASCSARSRYGAPPHAGFAFGIDRLVAIFAGEENIREVIAFPKTQSGADLMTGAPKAITERQLRDAAPARRAERFVNHVAL